MSWIRIVIEYVIAFVAMWAFQIIMPGFPKFGPSHIAVVAAAVALVAYAVTEMPGGYVSHYGRAVLAAIAGTSVLAVYFTLLPRSMGHPYAYLEAALAVGAVIGLAEFLIAPQNVREAHNTQ